jgi:anti-anti-sigma factor
MRSTHRQSEDVGKALAAIIVGYRKGVTVVDLVGEHDASTAESLSSTITEQASLNRGVVVSLTETEFVDSSIVRALFIGDGAMLAKGRRLVLHSHGQEIVQRVLDLAGVSEQLLTCVTLEEAIEFASQCYPQDGGP